MCGLFAIIDRKGRTALDHHALLDSLAHRGPDAAAVRQFALDGADLADAPGRARPHIALGHLRLSILDLDTRSDQPFTSADGTRVLVYNGEIYNYVELREELKTLGHVFRTTGDTEVLLAALEQWGADIALRRCEGMFAFLLYDRRTNRILAARDHLGIKPLFRADWEGGCAWASEVWPLLALPGVSRAPRPERLVQYILSGGQEHEGGSYFRAIDRVPSGCWEQLDPRVDTEPERHRFWQLEVPEKALPEAEANEAFRTQFLTNVRRHLRADVPWGMALSGGLDSSAVAGAVRHLEPDAEINTFSFLPETEEWSEEHWIDSCASYVGARVHKVRPTAAELIDDLPGLIRAQGEPFGTTSIYAQFRVMRLAAEAGMKVMLDGQGADELLGGYAPYVGARALSLLAAGRLGAVTRLIRRGGGWSAASPRAILKDMVRYAVPRGLARLLRRRAAGRAPYDWLEPALLDQAQVFAPGADSWGRGERFLKLTLAEATTHYGLPELLRYEDRNSMHVSLESRVPFLTGQMAELCMQLPESALIDGEGRTKSVLREAIQGLVPEEIRLRRDKIGFRPDIAGMNGPILEHFLDRAGDMDLPAGLDWDLVRRRLSSSDRARLLAQPWLWRVMCLGFWHDMVQAFPQAGAPATLSVKDRAAVGAAP